MPDIESGGFDSFMKIAPHSFIFIIIAILSVAVSFFNCTGAYAAKVRIKTISVTIENNAFLMKVNLTGASKPKVFSLNAKGSKPKVVVDFMGASAGRLPGVLTSDSPLVKRVRTGKHKNKVRFVLDLTPGYYFKVEQYFKRNINQYILKLTAE